MAGIGSLPGCRFPVPATLAKRFVVGTGPYNIQSIQSLHFQNSPAAMLRPRRYARKQRRPVTSVIIAEAPGNRLRDIARSHVVTD